jgi:ribonucleotide reductase alpha subunit
MSNDTVMLVLKRDGRKEEVSFDKILRRIQDLAKGLDHVNPTLIAQKVCTQLQNEMKTSQLDEFAAETAATMSARNHPDYAILAGRIAVSNHQKNTPERLTDVATTLYDEEIVSKQYHNHTINPIFDTMIDHERDFLFDYFGFKTLMNGYLLKRRDGRVWERPQHMWMRVAIQLHGENFDRVKETYDALSQGYFIHATPTLFNSGTPYPQLSSCFLVNMSEDSIKGIYKTLGDCAQISKWAGGIGLSVHNIRARASMIKGTNGKSTGIVPMLKVFNDTAKYVNQGGKRNGSFAIYLEPWHADVEEFLRLKLNQGNEEERARDLFYALWIPDLFMQRVEADGDWSLMCPHECPGLDNVYGDDFVELYTKYEAEKRYRKQMKAKKLWQMILDAQIQTGTPYLCYKDAANSKSNQKNIGVIKSSNLCVAPETLLVYREPHEENKVRISKISDIEGKSVSIWNGTSWSDVVIKHTGVNQKLLRVVVNTNTDTGGNGSYFRERVLYCTEYHKFLLPSPTGKIQDCPRVDAKDLVPGMILQNWRSASGDLVDSTIKDVTFTGRFDDTYCFNEPINHAGVFNGILTGNCTEIMEYSSPDETAVCNLGSLSLPKFVREDGTYDFENLRRYTAILIRNLNIVIDKNFYPTEETRRSNLRHRPVGLGIQGLADVFAKMKIAWTDEAAKKLNREIFENIYFAAVEQSVDLCTELWRGVPVGYIGSYETFPGSPASQGKLQYDLWEQTPTHTSYLNWKGLKERVQEFGMRNSLLIAPMPTASTSQILGNNECIEPFTSNLYVRRVLAGDFVVINKYLVNDLIAAECWNSDIRTQIIANNGSIQAIAEIPVAIRNLYKTAWEIPQKTLIDLAADRAPFICQSQSLNLFLSEPTYARVTSMHFYAWKKGLKTGCYYLRTKAVASAQKFTIEPTQATQECLMCSA